MRHAEYGPAVVSHGAIKRIVLIAFGVVLLLAVAMLYSVSRAAQEPVTHTPGPLENARALLRAQLEQAKKTESPVEQQTWNSPQHLRVLIDGHKERIDKLKDNREAAEIVSYDRDSIDRLEKRIAQIAEEQAAREEAAKEAAKQAPQEPQPQ